MLGELPKDIARHSLWARFWPCQSVLELEPSKGMVVMGVHLNMLIVIKKWSQISSDSQLAEGFDDGAWLCHFIFFIYF